MDNVKVVRMATAEKGEMVLLTQYLNVTPDTEIATTDQPVVITQAPGTVIHGIGLIFDKKQRTAKLLNKVRAHYVRPVLAPGAQPAAASQPGVSQTKVKPPKQPAARQTAPANKNPPPAKSNPAKSVKPTTTTNQNRVRRQYEHPASP